MGYSRALAGPNQWIGRVYIERASRGEDRYQGVKEGRRKGGVKDNMRASLSNDSVRCLGRQRQGIRIMDTVEGKPLTSAFHRLVGS